MRNVYIIISCIWFSCQLNAQSIYFEHIGPQDDMINSIWIPRDSNKIVYEIVLKKIPLLEEYYISPENFDLLECLLKNEIDNSNKFTNMPIWSNIKISFFDESMILLESKNICCGKEALKIFRHLMDLKKVRDNEPIYNLFSSYYQMISEGLESQ